MAGTAFLRLIGAFVRWVKTGFKVPFADLYNDGSYQNLITGSILFFGILLIIVYLF